MAPWAYQVAAMKKHDDSLVVNAHGAEVLIVFQTAVLGFHIVCASCNLMIFIKMAKTAGEKCTTLSSREDSRSTTWQKQSQPYCAATHRLNWKMLYASSIAQTHPHRLQVLNLALAGTLACLEKCSSGMGKPSM